METLKENNIAICPICEAKWINGQHYWATGRKGNEHDLAGLVCNRVNKCECINPCIGSEIGETWEDRNKKLNILMEEF